VLGFLAVFQWLDGTGPDPSVPSSYNELFPRGIKGFWGSLIYAFYAFGGIEVIGLMAMQLKQKQDAPKSGTALLLLLAIIYRFIRTRVSMVSFDQFTDKESPL
jgi:L-asparagine transporter-like permease